MRNPFLILPISVTASPSDILRAVTVAMRARTHDAKMIAGAQRILFDPLTRATAEFRYQLDVASLIAELPASGELVEPPFDKLRAQVEFTLLDSFTGT